MDRIFSYLTFYNFQAPPFSLVPDPRFFYPSRAHLDSLEVLTFALTQGSLITVLTGEPGLGKTQILLTLLSRIQGLIKPITILNPALGPQDFFETIFRELALEESFLSATNKDQLIKKLKDFFLTLEVEKQPRYLLVIDEAQLLPVETLEELRLLTNLNEGKSLFIQILLVGQPTLSHKLKSLNFSPLLQRISVWETIRPFEKEEILPYIWFRIRQVSDAPSINFEKSFDKPLYKWTKGIPRLINKLMDRTLFIAYVKGEKHLKKGHLKEAKKTFSSLLLEV